MSQVTFQVSQRVKKARLAWSMHRMITPIWFGSLALIALAAYFLGRGNQFGYILISPALVGLMVKYWYQWDLAVLPGFSVESSEGLPVDKVVSRDLAATLVWPISLPQLWELASRQPAGQFMIERLQLDTDELTRHLSTTEGSDDVWVAARQLQLRLELPELDAACLVAALLIHTPGALATASHNKLQTQDVLNVLLWRVRLRSAAEKDKTLRKLHGIGRDWASGYTPTLNRYAHNITEEVEDSSSSYETLARSQTIDQILTNLGKTERHNVIIVGPDGSGKTSLVYGLAERLSYASRLQSAITYQIMGLNPALLTSASQVPGEIEQLVLTLFSDAARAGNIMMFLDEAQLFLKAGVGALDLSQLLLSVIQQTNIRLIMALNPEDYQHLATSNPGLATQFNVVKMPELSQDDVISLLEDRAAGLEGHGVVVTYQALVESYRLAARHITTEAFPGKAIKLLEDSLNYPEGKLLTATSIQQCIERTMGIKAQLAGEEEKSQLLNLEDLLHCRMINQTRAVSAIATALRRNRAGVGSPKRPAGSFLFLGPTGVGKTELTKALADVYFGGVDHIIRLDMSEFQQPSDVSRILAPPAGGQVGTNLLSEVRQRPFSVVLLDEIEKAHPDLLNLLLQILDEGNLSDSNGQAVNFTNCIIIATSNAGADDIRAHIAAGEELEKFEKNIIDGLISSHQFRAELINRFDEVVLFRPLKPEELRQVAALMIAAVNETLSNQNITVELTDAALDSLVEKGFDPRLGARPLRRLIQQTVQNLIADGILAGKYAPGAKIKLDRDDLYKTPESKV